MSTTIPYGEPDSIRAGDTLEWKRSLADYPATTWTLVYSLVNSGAKITITASASGTDHLIDESAATTAAYTAGWYDWTAHVTDGTDRYTVDHGRIEVQPDLSAATIYDNRSHARIMLDAIESLLEGKTTADAQSSTHNGRSLTSYTWAELRLLRDLYRAEANAEDQAERLRNGSRTGRFVQVRLS